MRKIVNRACQVIGGVLILALMIIVTAEVIGRAAFGHTFLVANEYSGYIALMLTFIGIPYAMDQGALLRVNFLIDRLNHSHARLLELLFRVIAFLVSAVICHQLIRMTLKSYERGTFASTPARTPIWIPQCVAAVGMLLLLIVIFAQIMADLRASTRQSHESDGSGS